MRLRLSRLPLSCSILALSLAACLSSDDDDGETGSWDATDTQDTVADHRDHDESTEDATQPDVADISDVAVDIQDIPDTPEDGQDDPEVARICERWNRDREDLSEGSWSGVADECIPGDMTLAARSNALRLVNLYRFLAELPPVEWDDDRNGMAQECALMMHVNGSLNHSPPSSWSCYTADGATAAGSSNIASTPGVAAVDLSMVDPGNATTIGHRRWILSNSLGPIGIGSTDWYSCMWVLSGSGSAGAEWTAWPAPGVFPAGAFAPSWSSVDETGWTVQSDSIDLSGAVVTVTAGGTELPVTVRSLAAGYGSRQAISFVPDGWRAEAATTYEVEVTGVSPVLRYEVQVVDCSDF